MHWRRKWQPTPVFLPGESQGRGSLVGCRLWGRTESDMTEATQQRQQQLRVSLRNTPSLRRLWSCSYQGYPEKQKAEPMWVCVGCVCERERERDWLTILRSWPTGLWKLGDQICRASRRLGPRRATAHFQRPSAGRVPSPSKEVHLILLRPPLSGRGPPINGGGRSTLLWSTDANIHLIF